MNLLFYSACAKSFKVSSWSAISFTLFDMGFFLNRQSWGGGGGGMMSPHHKFVVIVPMIMKFAEVSSLTYSTHWCQKSLWRHYYCVIMTS